ncbi:MAG: Zn-dependent hydrolase [Bacteroidales bacterium]|nr:Zn-dependent hydrolase [Bacteroidota bacterium]MBL6949272.1 Zn-dependent hydrolase [Bacteroidales bacterium]
MKTIFSLFMAAWFGIILMTSCTQQTKTAEMTTFDSLMQTKVNEFVLVKLTTDMSVLTENEKKMIPLLIEVSQIMDDLYWQQAFRENKVAFLDSLTFIDTQKFAEINYGPWERLSGNNPFLSDYGPKPPGANFYPQNMTKEEFEAWDDTDKTSQYTFIWREEDGTLKSIWYHEVFKEEVEQAAGLLIQAASLAEDAGLKKYLEMRAKALVTDDYFDSDIAWLDMKTNKIDFVVGPIESYEDELYGYKTAYEAAVLIKDKEWSKRLDRFVAYLPKLQEQLPVGPEYKQEVPASGSDLNAYDIIYSAGNMNAGSKTIAINLPNDERVQLEKGSRRLQLKNAMLAKFDNILLPISGVLIDESQRNHIKFDAFFSNVMFHEVAHGLGIKNTINGKGTIREALKENYSAFEEAKADVLGLFMTIKLIEMGEIAGITPEDCFVTYMAGMFRSVRFGAASAHGKANMMCFNFFREKDAFERLDNNMYKVNFEKSREAMNEWAAYLLKLEGDGDYETATIYLAANGVIKPGLQAELDLLTSKNIPVDIVYDQGVTVLGLTE